MKPVWIVDDDQAIRWVLEKALARAGINTRSFSQANDVLAALEGDEPAALVSDIRMPGGNGLDLLRQIKEGHPALPVIVMTAFADLDSTVSAFQGGAFDYLAKPFDVNEAVSLIQRAAQESAGAEHGDPSAAQNEQGERWMMTQSASPAMQEIFRAIGRLAQSKVTVLITGESGTGKELVARALHGHGARAKGPFVALNAAAIPRDLLEAELFGHERGAFTGANTLRRGRFEEAHGGTLFLDEIGDMPIELQTRSAARAGRRHVLPRRRRAARAGGRAHRRRDAPAAGAARGTGLFREDLFHRLNVIRLRLPPLRERVEDIPALAQHFLTQSARQLGVSAKRLTPEALAVLTRFDFPGNVRQLENFCHWLTVMAPGQTIERADLPPEIRAMEQSASQPAVPRGMPAAMAMAPASAAPAGAAGNTVSAQSWQEFLLRDAQYRLDRGEPAIMATLTRQFERILLQTALQASRGVVSRRPPGWESAAIPSRASCATWVWKTSSSR